MELNAQIPQEVDPLSGASSGFEAPKYPVLAADRIVRFEITKAIKDSVKEDKEKQVPNPREMLVLTLKTTKDYSDKDGKPLRQGFTVYKRIGLYEIKGNPDRRDRTLKDQIGPELAQLLVCCGLGNRSPRELVTNPAIIEKALVDCKTSIVPPKDGYPESNNVVFVPPA